ncbi:MAG TPA: putative sulfate exporter family transporter [Solirubrobacteraceae bacterium]|jgi:uncharacterized integral membrane protein (TIGR00698 family)|nr:putative sulfate exporter family transporter [Solirubrobacteraceae bacterium]
MSTIAELPHSKQRLSPRARFLPGLALAGGVATAATAMSHFVGLGSAPVLGIVLGVAVGAIIGPRAILKPGLTIGSSALLRVAVVVLGLELPLGTIATQGIRALPIIAVTLGGCLIAAGPIGRRLGIAERVWTLIGVGTGICGASAIAAVTPVIEASELEVGYAVATIFLFNVLAVLAFPPLGRLLGMSPHTFGTFAGTAVNDLSSVVAAAGAYAGSLHTAVITKLTRTLMIVPICVVLRRRCDRAGGSAHGAREAGDPRFTRRTLTATAQLVPGFLIVFLAFAALRSLGVVPAGVRADAGPLATILITVALSAVGLSIDVRALRRVGPRPVLLGLMLWLIVSGLSLAVQAL